MLPLENAVDHLKRAASAADAMLGREDSLPPATQARINASLANIDQLLLDPQGLPGRPWFQNLVYAPGTLTGYGAKTLPGVREAIEQRRLDDARAYVVRTAKVIEDYADRLDAAAAMAKSRHDRHDHSAASIELAAAVLILAAGIWFYRRRDPPPKGGQLRQPGRGDPVRGRRDHGHPRAWRPRLSPEPRRSSTTDEGPARALKPAILLVRLRKHKAPSRDAAG